jgi:SAM-dependent methyltransferase
MLIFNNTQRIAQLKRAAKRFREHDFLYQLVSKNIAERIEQISKTFTNILELGSKGILSSLISSHHINHPQALYVNANIDNFAHLKQSVICDYELLPFANSSFDLIISALELHYVNDLAGTLAQLHACLKKDGMMILAIIGGCSLHELRDSIISAEIANDVPVSPHIIPMAQAKDLADLMQRVGYKNVIVDTALTCVSYTNVLALMRDLRYMGQGNNLVKKSNTCFNKKTLASIEQIYMKKYSSNNLLNASFEIITMTGIKYD